jgi:hypothetical protein
MKDFDVERQERSAAGRDDRAFVLGGETFHALAEVAPEALTRFESMDSNPDIPLSETLAVIDDTILSLIEDAPEDGHARYRKVRAETPDLGVATLLDLAKWLVEVQTGRPTEPQPPSTDSPAETGTESTDTSSSQDSPEV